MNKATTEELLLRNNDIDAELTQLILDCTGNSRALGDLFSRLSDAKETCRLNLANLVEPFLVQVNYEEDESEDEDEMEDEEDEVEDEEDEDEDEDEVDEDEDEVDEDEDGPRVDTAA